MTAEVQPWVLIRRRFTYHKRLLLHDKSHQKCSFGDSHAGSDERALIECDVISATNFVSF